MRKVCVKKRNVFVVLFAFLLCCVFSIGMLTQNEETEADAAASTAAIKGYVTNGLTYIKDQNNESQNIRTDSYHYGSFSMWSACYKYVCTEPDGSRTCYYYALVESSINSAGKYGKYHFFRNKYLDILIDFYSKDGGMSLANYTPESSESTSSSTVSLGATNGVDVSMSDIGVNFGGSIGYTKTVTYDNVNLKVDDAPLKNGNKNILFSYKFMNWDNGSMVAPNVGLVRKRVVAIFSVENYSGGDNYEMSITTTATIFKDATWPRSNATLSGEIVHKY